MVVCFILLCGLFDPDYGISLTGLWPVIMLIMACLYPDGGLFDPDYGISLTCLWPVIILIMACLYPDGGLFYLDCGICGISIMCYGMYHS